MLYFKGMLVKIPIYLCISFPGFYLPSQTVQTPVKYAVFHLCLHCLPKYMFTCIQYENETGKFQGRLVLREQLTKFITHFVCIS